MSMSGKHLHKPSRAMQISETYYHIHKKQIIKQKNALYIQRKSWNINQKNFNLMPFNPRYDVIILSYFRVRCIYTNLGTRRIMLPILFFLILMIVCVA